MEKRKKRTFIFLIVFIVSVLAHNIIYGLFGIEEPVFFMLAALSFLAFIFSALCCGVHCIKGICKSKKK